jgi:hypothetical protein
VFRPDANLGLRIARTVLVPSGPLILMVVLTSSHLFSERLAGFLMLVAFAWFFSSLIIVPALLFRDDSGPGSSSDDDGGGAGPQEPPSPDRGPGAIPLPDAEQSRERVRDHVRRKPQWLRRRSAREPRKTPLR